MANWHGITHFHTPHSIGAWKRDNMDGDPDELAAEFADVLAWLVTIANVSEVNLTAAVLRKYGNGCPGCGEMVCTCDDAEKP